MEHFNGYYVKILSKEERTDVIDKYLVDDHRNPYWHAVYTLVETGFPRKFFIKFKDPYLQRCDSIRSGWRSDSDYSDYIECEVCNTKFNSIPEDGIFKVNTSTDYIEHMIICCVCNNILLDRVEDIIKTTGSIEYKKLMNIYLLITSMFNVGDIVHFIGLIMCNLHLKI